ncbi:acyltransferase [Ancylostoma ceylanicum]|uniref:Acyltransferase n=1 Tax=Ancylostoma ceylanicum TaxID=53326 RepID=A0A0D6LN54_9BILA|nr:acyltransferase [Ancylostoma ceylanicum]
MSEKRQDIQGLRGWAIIMVVLFHFFPRYFPNGYVGVDVFFVISGFLIAMVLLKNDQLNLSAIVMFYYKRIKRILPLYYLVIVSILLTILLLLPPYYEEANIRSSWRAIILISNFKKKNIDDDYKDMLIGAEDLFTHTWSLCVEMQWYLLVPIIFVAQRLLTTWQKTFFTGKSIQILINKSITSLVKSADVTNEMESDHGGKTGKVAWKVGYTYEPYEIMAGSGDLLDGRGNGGVTSFRRLHLSHHLLRL